MGKVDWAKLDDDWFLFPNLWKVPFTAEIIMGFEGGGAWGMDEYGRQPGNPNYKDRERHDKGSWVTCQNAKLEWAKSESASRWLTWTITRARMKWTTT